MKRILSYCVVVLLCLSGCASNRQVEEQASATNSDPLEPVNRVVWEFNWELLDKHVIRPFTVAYVEYMPGFARTGLFNFARNLDEPGNFVNNLLQGKVEGSATSVGRFLVNSTVGLFGTIDIASDIGMERQREDFGQTLGVWGLDTGPYIMLPVIGPSDTRSFAGTFTDFLYWPVNEMSLYWNIFTFGIKGVEARAALMAQEQLVYDSLDSYSLVQDIYFQNLENQVNDGAIQAIQEDELEEDEELDDLLDDF